MDQFSGFAGYEPLGPSQVPYSAPVHPSTYPQNVNVQGLTKPWFPDGTPRGAYGQPDVNVRALSAAPYSTGTPTSTLDLTKPWLPHRQSRLERIPPSVNGEMVPVGIYPPRYPPGITKPWFPNGRPEVSADHSGVHVRNFDARQSIMSGPAAPYVAHGVFSSGQSAQSLTRPWIPRRPLPGGHLAFQTSDSTDSNSIKYVYGVPVGPINQMPLSVPGQRNVNPPDFDSGFSVPVMNNHVRVTNCYRYSK